MNLRRPHLEQVHPKYIPTEPSRSPCVKVTDASGERWSYQPARRILAGVLVDAMRALRRGRVDLALHCRELSIQMACIRFLTAHRESEGQHTLCFAARISPDALTTIAGAFTRPDNSSKHLSYTRSIVKISQLKPPHEKETHTTLSNN